MTFGGEWKGQILCTFIISFRDWNNRIDRKSAQLKSRGGPSPWQINVHPLAPPPPISPLILRESIDFELKQEPQSTHDRNTGFKLNALYFFEA